MLDYPQISPADCVLYKDKDGSVMSCGYTIENELLRQGVSPMMVMEEGKKGSKVSDLFANLAVPMGLLTVGTDCCNEYTSSSTLDSDVVDRSLYDRLLDLAADAKSGTTPHTKDHNKTVRNKDKLSRNKTRNRRKG
jgi:hypothetical protein